MEFFSDLPFGHEPTVPRRLIFPESLPFFFMPGRFPSRFPLSGALTHVSSCCGQNDADVFRALTLSLTCLLLLTTILLQTQFSFPTHTNQRTKSSSYFPMIKYFWDIDSFRRYLLNAHYEPGTWGYRNIDKIFAPKKFTVKRKKWTWKKEIHIYMSFPTVASILKKSEGRDQHWGVWLSWGLPEELSFRRERHYFSICITFRFHFH